MSGAIYHADVEKLFPMPLCAKHSIESRLMPRIGKKKSPAVAGGPVNALLS